MKILLIILSILPGIAFAQFDKGQVYLGGTLSTSLNSSSAIPATTSSNTFGIAPNLNFFLNEKFSLGASIGYTYNKADIFYPQIGVVQSTTMNTITLSTRARYYLPISSTFYIAFQGQMFYQHSNFPSYLVAADYSYGINFSPVFVFFPTPKWGVEGAIGLLGYSQTHYPANESLNNNFSLSAGSFSFGLAYYFKRK